MTLNRNDKVILESWGVSNVHFIPSGIRVEKFLRLPRVRHPILNFLSVGRYDTPQKGFDLTIPAIYKFNCRHPRAKAIFHFAGSGPSETVVEQAASKIKNILNHGFVNYEHIPNLYKSADVFLLSSRAEPFGLILIEAWSSGLPVLATHTAGPNDMLIQNQNGWFIDQISVEGILAGLESVYQLWLKSPNQLIEMSPLCRSTGEKYSIDTTATRMRQLF